MEQTFSVNVLLDTLVNSSTGSITGKICVETATITFPEIEWNDFVVIIIEWWLKELTSLTTGECTKGTCRFMDGPFEFQIDARDPERWLIHFIRKGKFSDEQIAWNELAPDTVIAGVMSGAKSIIDVCQQKEWHSPELTSLINTYKKAVEASNASAGR